MARRSSARLRNRNSSTPQRVSLSHDALQTPRTAPVSKMASLAESDEMPGSFPRSESPPGRKASAAVPTHNTQTIPVKFDDTTPKRQSPVEPSDQEMHPQKHHQSTIKPYEEARWLGFSNMAPHTEPPKRSNGGYLAQETPTKAATNSSGVNPPYHQFTFRREQSLELSPEAKKLMSEKRGEAAKIREQMIASGEKAEDIDAAIQRKVATPKGKKGRFSQVHMEQFKKMDSIAGHASAYRTDLSKSSTAKSPMQGDSRKTQNTDQTASKSVKRSASKAQLDDGNSDSPRRTLFNPAGPTTLSSASKLPRAGAIMSSGDQARPHPSSPAKRVRTIDHQDASNTRPSSSEGTKKQPATPQPTKVRAEPSYPDLSSLASPTQASLARAASIKSVKCKIPGPVFSQSQAGASKDGTSAQQQTTALARSPSKVSMFDRPSSDKQQGDAGPLLQRTPSRPSPIKRPLQTGERVDDPQPQSPLLARSPLKMSTTKSSNPEEAKGDQKAQEEPFLSRSPMKRPELAKASETNSDEGEKSSSIPFLSRSPAKVTIPKDHDSTYQSSPDKSLGGGNLMGRFNLLRRSPVKSILRSPQRLYSDDPSKIAAGTHLATPPKPTASGTSAASSHKHVDFSASTKARQERAQAEQDSSTPGEAPTPVRQLAAPNVRASSTSPAPSATYPTLPSGLASVSPARDVTPIFTPQKRRETAAPRDFTFRAGGHDIVFGPVATNNAAAPTPNQPRPSPSATTSRSGGHRSGSTIRHVSAEPTPAVRAIGVKTPASAAVPSSKKRKFEFENVQAEDEALGGLSDKENSMEAAMEVDNQRDGDDDEGEGHRPAKRVKSSAAPSAARSETKKTGGAQVNARSGMAVGARAQTKPVQRRTTLGVKPKRAEGEARAPVKKPAGTISQARLAALAQPKKRV